MFWTQSVGCFKPKNAEYFILNVVAQCDFLAVHVHHVFRPRLWVLKDETKGAVGGSSWIIVALNKE